MMQTQCAEKQVFEEPAERIAFQFRVFRDQEYVRLNGFKQSKITIGRSHKADLVLDDRSVAEFHADVAIMGGLFFLTNYKPNNGLRVNGRSAKKIQLKDSDVIDIGPFSMVFKPVHPAAPKRQETEDKIAQNNRIQVADAPGKDVDERPKDWFDDSYAVVLDNEYEDGAAREEVAERLGILFQKSPEKMLPLLSRPGQVVKKDVSLKSAQRLLKLLEMAGAEAELRPMGGPERQEPKGDVEAKTEHEPASEPELKPEIAPVLKPEIGAEVKPEITPEVKKATPAYEPDEDDEDDPVANFNLKDRLGPVIPAAPGLQRSGGPPQLEVVKSIGGRVVDVQHIGGGRGYRVDGEKKRFRLASLGAKSGGHIRFPEDWKGHVLSNGNQAPLEDYKTGKYLHRKRARLYRVPISQGDTVVVTDGHCEYQVRHVIRSESPVIIHRPKAREITWRHWGASAGFHLVFLLIACIIFALSNRVVEEDTLHFVKIDMAQFDEQILPEVKETPKPPAPEKKVEPPKVEPAKTEPVKPTKKVTEVQKKVAQKPAETQSPTPEVAGGSKDAATNSHPDAGGGFGEGNIVNRNINQTGLLSLLGDGPSDSSASSGAMIAEVTNLDAVEVPGASSSQFSVGGIKGSLGDGKISLASGQAVQTKGTHQVLRSVGASGPGTVAAMEKGEIGNKQVKGMVTAKMSKTVSIQGGMSREMVKRVIDAHLDEIQYCYESALIENPAIMGRIVYEWKILMSGNVGEVRIVSSSVNSHIIHNCIKEAIKTWQFPKPGGSEVVVSYPFVFDLVGF
jgi:pSer/pThr/pTyr-binding forkhead associated (FHA) protein/outer membrane biosynthesis protein TonB